jgi:hypothetical protein
VLDALYGNLSHADLPVRVNSALALIKMMSHEFAIEFVRPGLGQVIKIYLKLIDDIDYDELIDSLKIIVEIFSAEIAPYAEDLCMRLGESFVRLMDTQKGQNGGDALELDNETCLTVDGLITAIRRIL